MYGLHVRAIGLTVAVTSLIILLFHYGRFFQNGSPDLIQHYRLINELMSRGTIAPDAYSRIGLMALYPFIAHWMAALIGWIGGSALVGITLICIVSAFVAYCIILLLLSESPVALIIFLIGFALMRKTASLIGWEIVGNFFYPQLVGDTLYLFALLCLTKEKHLACQAMTFIFLGALAMWLQPLNAVHIMATGCVLVALQGIRRWHERGKFPTEYALAGLCVFVAAAAVTLRHPVFEVMRKIASNNGDLGFGFQHIMVVVWIFFIVSICNAWRYSFRGAQSADLVLCAAGIASCLLAIMQFTLWKLHGDGSLYAVKKHMFIVVTIGLMNVSTLVAALVNSNIRIRWPRPTVVVPIIAAFLSTFVLHGFSEPIGPTEHALRSATHIASYDFDNLKPGNTVAFDTSLPILSNALVSVIAFHHPFDANEYRWWYGTKITEGAQYAMVRRNPTLDKNCPTQYARTVDYELIDSSCLNIYALGDVISFSSSGSGTALLGRGWYDDESSGTWSMGNSTSTLSLVLPKMTHVTYKLTVDGSAFVSPKHQRQQIEVEANGIHVATWIFTLMAPEGKKVAIIPENTLSGEKLELAFKAPDAVSPTQVGFGKDNRVLGIYIRSLALDPSQ